MQLKVKRTDPRVQLPGRATAGSAGMDLRALLEEPLTLEPGGRASVPTGIAIGLPSPETVGLVFARSGMACKRGLAPANKVGVIDADYRGHRQRLHGGNPGGAGKPVRYGLHHSAG